MQSRIPKSLQALVGLVLISLVAGIARSKEVPALTPDQFHMLQLLIKPRPGEDKWAEIPWMSSLWEARQRAADLGKPILLWEMDGNPLGCG